MTSKTLLLICALLPCAALAQPIYKCTDQNGGTLISNTRVDKSCKVVASEHDNAAPAPRPGAPKASATPTPAGFPKVEQGTQKNRDGDRRHILEQELAGEQRSLEQARRELSEVERQPGVTPDRLAPYRDRVGQHERNIQALQREMAALR